ncbi:hypothetical protein D918_09339 [Trichuris suis]|nr:hypothetical protein D918_09339 [Trichuris suis]
MVNPESGTIRIPFNKQAKTVYEIQCNYSTLYIGEPEISLFHLFEERYSGAGDNAEQSNATGCKTTQKEEEEENVE